MKSHTLYPVDAGMTPTTYRPMGDHVQISNAILFKIVPVDEARKHYARLLSEGWHKDESRHQNAGLMQVWISNVKGRKARVFVRLCELDENERLVQVGDAWEVSQREGYTLYDNGCTIDGRFYRVIRNHYQIVPDWADCLA